MVRQAHAGNLGGLGRAAGLVCFLLLAVVCTVGSVGCTRRFFRNRADEEVSAVLTEKDKYPDWKIEQMHVYPDPRARFADPNSPDRPPMPPDDPAAWDLSPHPQKPGKAGIGDAEGTGYLELLAAWDKQNRAEKAAAAAATNGKDKTDTPPGPPPSPPTEEAKSSPSSDRARSYTTTILMTEPRPGTPPPYLLKQEQACELALINSREYQDARENLYLAALPVTLERFSFAAQFFAAGQVIREWAGRQTPVGSRNDWAVNSNTGFSKLFPTGALLLFNFANQTVINLAGTGPRPVTSQSTINLDIVQPLLQGAGCAVTLEPLTQAERNLLYQIRDYARFRKELYVAIAGGGGGSITGASFQPTGVIAAATFSPTGGLGGSGLLPGVIPPVPITGHPGLQVSPGSSGQLFLGTALAAPVSGYLSTLLQSAQTQVDRYNIEKLEYFFELAKALQEGGDISQLQTDTFEQQLLRGRQSLLVDQQNYLQNIDQFKLQLGMPVHLRLELDDTPFRPLNQQFARYEDLFHQFKDASDAPGVVAAPDVVDRVRRELRRLFTSTPLTQGTRFRTQIEARWSAWEKLSAEEVQKRLQALREERRRLLDRQTDLETKGLVLSAADQQRLSTVENEIDLGELESILRLYEGQPWRAVQDPELRRRRQRALFGDVTNAYIVVLIQARNERMQDLHSRWPELDRVCVSGVDLMKGDLDDAEAAVAQYALVHRLDLMNVRGQVVDTWRNVAVFANALLAPLNVGYSLTTTTPSGQAKPLAFSESRTQQQIQLNFALPLVRVRERNNYRACLIAFQRARRILQRAEDAVAYDVRQELILLRQALENYRIQTRQVELAYLTVENSLDTLRAPAAPSPAGAQAVDTATRAASLTNQLINAQTSLYNAQFTMTTIWITFLNTRDQLYRDMELMPLDERGVWIDEVAKCLCPPNATAEKPVPQGGEGAPPGP
jgi:hypothetical protein